MNVIAVLLCTLANQVASQTTAVVTEFFPARILAQQKTISENSDLYATCSTFGLKKHKKTTVHVYLCKDDHVIKKKSQKQDQNDTTFTIPKVHLNYSGNYSCVYSLKDHSGLQVPKRGDNTITILVIANFLPADISVAGPSTVSEGDDVALRCTVSDTLQTLGGCQLIHSYLMRNESILQVQTFNVMQMEAVFTIEGAVVRDSGHYSCVVLPSKCIQESERTLYGNNAVLLKVKDEGSFFLRVVFTCGVTTVILALGLCLWCIKQVHGKSKGNSASCKPRTESQEANTAVMLEEQQEQAEEEDLEAQDGESFSDNTEEDEEEDEHVRDFHGHVAQEFGLNTLKMEYKKTARKKGDEEEDVYTVPAEESDSYDDCEGLYSTADDLPARPPACVYSTSQKKQLIQCSPDFTNS